MRISDWSSDVCSSDLTELVDLTKNVQFSEEYRKKNPWARVPALQIDDQILTENIAILSYIAGLVPQKQLLPDTGLARARALEWLALLSSTVHVAFRPIFRPNRLAESAQAQQDVAATGLIALRNVLALLAERLGEGHYTLGNQFSLCDLYLFRSEERRVGKECVSTCKSRLSR